jgi:hypothetical protein
MEEYPLFIPTGGGLGASLSCTGTSSSAAIPNPTLGSIWCINNTGTDYVHLAFGGSGIVATTAYMAFPPGLSYVGIPDAKGGGAPTYVAGITGGATITVQITVGNVVGQ